MNVYFDNAATTPLDPEVFEAMKPYMTEFYGNPSSIHSHGRRVRSAIEKARKTVAELLNVSPAEIFFTSGGTEADNTAICRSVESLNIKHAVTSAVEHHAVLHTLETLEKAGKIKISMVELDQKGHLDYHHLEELLRENPKSLVSLMHANNEIGNLADIKRISMLCYEYKSIFHSDTVQSIAHYRLDLQDFAAHCLVGSAHKFHGPKGIGFLYLNSDHKIPPYIMGGGQERNMRGGTENVYGIVGLAKAMEIGYNHLDQHEKHIRTLKKRMVQKLRDQLPGVDFNGDSASPLSLYTVLNVCLPPTEDNDMLLFNLDINNISASGGSACSSGSSVGSHVLESIHSDPNRGAIRFSFSKFNEVEEVDYVVDKLAELYSIKA